jgi:hypothetical protein
VHLNVIFPDFPSYLFWVSYYSFVSSSHVCNTCYLFHPSVSRFDHPNLFSEWYKLRSSSYVQSFQQLFLYLMGFPFLCLAWESEVIMRSEVLGSGSSYCHTTNYVRWSLHRLYVPLALFRIRENSDPWALFSAFLLSCMFKYAAVSSLYALAQSVDRVGRNKYDRWSYPCVQLSHRGNGRPHAPAAFTPG